MTCRVWDLQGQCQEVVKGHKGRSIWSMAINHAGQVVVSPLFSQFYLIRTKVMSLVKIPYTCTVHRQFTYPLSFMTAK